MKEQDSTQDSVSTIELVDQNIRQIITKYCPRCLRVKPATLVHFYKDPKRKAGLSFYCKTCTNLASAESYRKHKKVRQANARDAYARRHGKHPSEVLPEGSKRCTKCLGIKPATTIYFSPSKVHKSGLSPHCKLCRALASKAKRKTKHMTPADLDSWARAETKRIAKYFLHPTTKTVQDEENDGSEVIY